MVAVLVITLSLACVGSIDAKGEAAAAQHCGGAAGRIPDSYVRPHHLLAGMH